MTKLTPEQERDREVTAAIVDTVGAFKGVLSGFSHLCEAGAEYLEAKNRERFFHGHGPYPGKKVAMETPVKPEKFQPRSKV